SGFGAAGCWPDARTRTRWCAPAARTAWRGPRARATRCRRARRSARCAARSPRCCAPSGRSSTCCSAPAASPPRRGPLWTRWPGPDAASYTPAKPRRGCGDSKCAACYVEVESSAQLAAACAAGATRILIDNQPPDTVREWARAARRLAPAIEIEATGGITLATVRRYAEAGADFVSVGALTHSVHAADLALELV